VIVPRAFDHQAVGVEVDVRDPQRPYLAAPQTGVEGRGPQRALLVGERV